MSYIGEVPWDGCKGREGHGYDEGDEDQLMAAAIALIKQVGETAVYQTETGTDEPPASLHHLSRKIWPEDTDIWIWGIVIYPGGGAGYPEG